MERYQFDKGVTDGIRGLLFTGPPGIGKTELAKLIAKDNGSKLFFVDGSEVARSPYGESERRLKEIFKRAKQLGGSEHAIILFDDVESLIMARGALLAKEWHYALNSIFFHGVDETDTSKAVVICTTNRYDLVDEAIKDRFYKIEFPMPSKQDLKLIAGQLCSERRFHLTDKDVLEKIQQEIETNDGYKTVRDVENLVTARYIEFVTHSSAGQHTA
jgi:transitional endoplasmic reticulum ATPase